MLETPRALVVPFAVPPEGAGLGLGLAALVHGFVRLNGNMVGLAQVLPQVRSERDTPLEAFLAPDAWKSLAARGDAPPGVNMVVTGAFQPPGSGSGHIQLLAFDTADGSARARGEAHLDAATCGRGLVDALGPFWKAVGGELGPLTDVGELDWETLESVLRAERCALLDPRRGGPHDRYAAMVHLGRAVADAPTARFPAGRLAAVAIEAVMASQASGQGTEAALRVLHRACVDAPERTELLETMAGLHVRLGNAEEGESAALQLVGRNPSRPAVYALLAEARRMKRDLPGAEAAITRGLELDPNHPVLLTELGALFALRGDQRHARDAWEHALEHEALFVPAYLRLSEMAMRRDDDAQAGALIDRALTARFAHPEVLRQAMRLNAELEPKGVARSARAKGLAQRLLSMVPGDAPTVLFLARALVELGEKAEARERFLDVERLAPKTIFGAAAEEARFRLDEPEAARRLDACRRAAMLPPASKELAAAVKEARALADKHPGWLPRFVVGVTERGRGDWVRARAAFKTALEACPGASQAHISLVEVYVAIGDHDAAIEHAGAAVDLEGEKPDTLGIAAGAYLAAGRLDEAEYAVERALALVPDDEIFVALSKQIALARRGAEPYTSLVDRLRPSKRKAKAKAAATKKKKPAKKK